MAAMGSAYSHRVAVGKPLEGGSSDRQATRSDVHGGLSSGSLSDLPDPQPLGVPARSRKEGGREGRRQPKRRATRNRRSEDPDEGEEIRTLKETHYIWHCQACLGAAEPRYLAPRSSYAGRAEHRRFFIDAHHVLPLYYSGPREAGNLLILCRHHHSQLGDVLDPESITQALESSCSEQVRTFSSESRRASQRLAGVLATVSVDSQECNVPLFFTKKHAAAWREG